MEKLLIRKEQIEGLLRIIERQIEIQKSDDEKKLKKVKKSFNEFLKENNEIKKCYVCEKNIY
jgi:uncharacterized membrane protein (DUF106 family)